MLPERLLIPMEFLFHGAIRSLLADLVQNHGYAGYVQTLQQPRGAIQFLLGRRAGLHHKNSYIGNPRQILGMRGYRQWKLRITELMAGASCPMPYSARP